MSDGHIYFAESVDRDSLVEWLRNHFNNRACRLGMRADNTDLGEFDPQQAAQEVSAWSQGRVFDRTREVRWEQRGADVYAVWVLGEALPAAGELEELPGSWTAVQVQERLFLWGRYDPTWTDRKGKDMWIEVRIPRPLHHPATPPPETEKRTEKLFARLGHIEYRAPNGAVQFTRLTEVT